jgi:hypothetical protein
MPQYMVYRTCAALCCVFLLTASLYYCNSHLVAQLSPGAGKGRASSPKKKTGTKSPQGKGAPPANYRSRINEYYRTTLTNRDL